MTEVKVEELGTDAAKWADKFMEIKESGVPVDWGLMVSWFANAMGAQVREDIKNADKLYAQKRKHEAFMRSIDNQHAPKEERKLVFVDLETTGLDYESDRIVELAYAVEDGPIKTLYFGVKTVPDFIDSMIGFTERGLADMPTATKDELEEFTDICDNQTLVSANPTFEEMFLTNAGLFTFYHRKLDIESFAKKALRINYVPGMKQIREILTVMGYDVTDPLHTAASDVAALRDSYYILEREF